MSKKGYAGLAAMVQPVRPWLYRFLREKNGVVWISLRLRYRMASPSGSPLLRMSNSLFTLAWNSSKLVHGMVL